MLSLPDKPWRRVRLVPEGEGRYRLTFLSGIGDRADFAQTVLEDLEACLSRGDQLTGEDWESRSVTVTTANLDAFVQNLALHRLMVESQS